MDSQTSMINFRLSTDVKKQMEEACRDMGMSLSTAFTIFAVKVGRERRIPFEITADPFYGEENQNYILKSVKELRKGKGTAHELIEVDDDGEDMV